VNEYVGELLDDSDTVVDFEARGLGLEQTEGESVAVLEIETLRVGDAVLNTEFVGLLVE